MELREQSRAFAIASGFRMRPGRGPLPHRHPLPLLRCKSPHGLPGLPVLPHASPPPLFPPSFVIRRMAVASAVFSISIL
eukprot:scaffold30738_cov105-Isochrysis_galbana.AAC.4